MSLLPQQGVDQVSFDVPECCGRQRKYVNGYYVCVKCWSMTQGWERHGDLGSTWRRLTIYVNDEYVNGFGLQGVQVETTDPIEQAHSTVTKALSEWPLSLLSEIPMCEADSPELYADIAIRHLAPYRGAVDAYAMPPSRSNECTSEVYWRTQYGEDWEYIRSQRQTALERFLENGGVYISMDGSVKDGTDPP